MRRRVFFSIALVLGLVLGYLDFRLIWPLRKWPELAGLFALILLPGQAAILWLPLFYWASESTETRPYEVIFERIAHVAMGFHSLLLFLCVFREAAWLASIPFPFLSGVNTPEASLVVIGTAFLLAGVGHLIARSGPTVRRVAIPTTRLQGMLRIVHISDLHVGTWIGRRYVERVAALIETCGPVDLFILTGDIGDGDPERHASDLEPLSRIPARIGKFSVSGNHEGYWNEASWNAVVCGLGFRVLENEGVELSTPNGPISIHGVSDVGANAAHALATVKPERFSLFLAHQPHHAEAAILAGASLQLSGHTHSGQFIPWSLIIRFVHRFASGLYLVDGTAIYVNAGTGFWGPPFRLGTRSEITLLEIG